ncbi:AMP-binding protein [Blastococcus sp. URHD0036]|uniref:AMP-binding protein n=1 Tax=Blastococcus sp. URHD0036 TaxID=1380356 RepID=UPI00068D50D8|nr:AMP-binding protein [Blastococcus sp. URHD0036]
MPGGGAGADRGLSAADPSDAVRELLIRLATIGDHGDPADYRDVYTDDVEWRWGADVQRGVDAVVAAATQRRAEGSSGPGSGTRHEVAPRVVRVDGDTATAASSFRFVRADGEVLVAGSYADDLVRTPAGWRIRRREVRVPARSVAGLLAAAAEDAPDVIALVAGDRRLTYRELDTAVRDRAAGWSAAGLRRADRVAVLAVPTLDRAVEMLAVVAAGGVLVPLNPRYTDAEVRGILQPARCRFLLAPPSGAGHDLLTDVEHADAGLAAIQFTSGSTGRPKGAMLREEPMLLSAAGWAATVGLRRGDVFPVTYPLAHVGGFKTALLSPFTARATVVLLPEVSRTSLVGMARELPMSVLSAPPAALGYLLEAVRSGELPRPAALRTVVTGSAVVSPELVRAVVDELGAADVVVAYGLTEATGVVTMTRPGDPVELVCETIGAPVEDVAVRVRPDGPPGTVGDLEVRGPTVMAGYLDDAAATAAAVDADGWLRTGDLARIGDDGYVRIVGRSADTVIVGGFNVHPAEVERVLAAHPAVREAAVVGAPDERVGEVPVAFVVLRPGTAATGAELGAWCAGSLADFKVPRRLRLLEDLPRTAGGKVAREELRRLAPDVG